MKQVYKGFGFLKKEAMDGYICWSCKRDGYIERDEMMVSQKKIWKQEDGFIL